MARGNMVALVVAGIFLASALCVSAAGTLTFEEVTSTGDSAFAFDPNSNQEYTPPPTPIVPPPPSPTVPAPTAPTTPASSPGSCPEDFTKNFQNTFKIFTDTDHVIVGPNGDSAEMLLDKRTAAVAGTKNMYYTGRFSAWLKLPCGNSSGTVFAFYLSSNGSKPDHDEIDIEILGNTTDKTYTLQTNIFVNGYGNREMRHDLVWFEPCQDYHEYFIQWNSALTVIGVDDVPLRVFYNKESEDIGQPYFNKGQALMMSYWDGSKWATQGGKYKCDFEKNGPFIADIKDFHKLQGCQVPWERDVAACKNPATPHCWDAQTELTPEQVASMNSHKQYCTYDYCQDYQRFKDTGFPKDCSN
ncbi:hypothetical protein KC19_9G083700 [Ceratodon purpureus]|uniref:Xyloglucan endotransglucosylase/hydrolase n=1 Tax=Ceratodon purpureus TaxID=3225 RepID=A0A8T0GRR5_CERPU|nr:hypothetical protein KC19_9G083700 [Ceratodon purpureus]